MGGRALGSFDTLMAQYGAWGVLVVRLFPVISFDLVSFAAGLTAMRAGPFGLATFVGMLPAALAFSLLGDSLTSANRWSLIGGAGLLSVLLLSAACMRKSAVWRRVHRAHPVSGDEAARLPRSAHRKRQRLHRSGESSP